jgi:hypothetical protein
MKKIYILGADKIGWSIDKDRMYTIKAIEKLDDFEITQSYFEADIIYVVWWNQLLSLKYKFLNIIFNKKIIACITNDLTHQQKSLQKVLENVDLFVYANSKQKETLLKNNINERKLYFNPFYVDENIFKPLDITKKELCLKFNIDFEDIKEKRLIGSFQRDSLGADLAKPKWQKTLIC